MDKINRDILKLSIPAIVSNVTVPLLGLCDTAISGHLGSELYLAAIAVGTVMLNVVFWLFGFLRMGTTGMTAGAFGAGDDNEVRRIFARAFLLAFVAGLLLILFRYPLMDLLLAIIDSDKEVREYVARYFIIRIWGAPALLGVLTISGWFVGMQSTVYPMGISIAVNVVNIICSFLLVFHGGLGFEGVAWGTLISNWFGLALALWCVVRFRRGKGIWCGRDEILKGGGLGRFFKVNGNLFVRSGCIICVTMGVTAAGARLGSLALAVNVIVMQFFQFFSFFMDGFAFSGEALVGKWLGAGSRDMLRRYCRRLLIWSAGMGIAFTLLYSFGSPLITELLTDSASVREGVSEMRLWIALIPVVSVWAFTYDGFFVGITDTRRMRQATLLATIVFFLVAFVRIDSGGFFIRVENNSIIWIAFLSYLLMRGVALAALWRNSLRKALDGHKSTSNKTGI